MLKGTRSLRKPHHFDVIFWRSLIRKKSFFFYSVFLFMEYEAVTSIRLIETDLMFKNIRFPEY